MVKLTDTAGLRLSNDPIEKLGIMKSFSLADTSQCIYLLSIEKLDRLSKSSNYYCINDPEAEFHITKIMEKKKPLILANKIDLQDSHNVL